MFIFIPPISNTRLRVAHQGINTDDKDSIPDAGEKLPIARLQRRLCLRSAVDQCEAATQR